MQFGTAPLLERHRIFRSRCGERRALLGKDFHFELSPRLTRRLNTRINAFYMPSMHLGYLHYGNLPVELCPGLARRDFLVQLPVCPRNGGDGFDSNPSRAVIFRRCTSDAGSCRARTAPPALPSQVR